MELLVMCLAFGVIGAAFLALIYPLRLVVLLLVVMVPGGILAGVWGHTVDVSTANRQSRVDVPYWVWIQPFTEDEWQIWEDPSGRESDRRYKMPKASRCQMFDVNRRRLVPMYEDDQVTTARYEIHWLYRLLNRFTDECDSGTVIRFNPQQRSLWLHALSGWGRNGQLLPPEGGSLNLY